MGIKWGSIFFAPRKSPNPRPSFPKHAFPDPTAPPRSQAWAVPESSPQALPGLARLGPAPTQRAWVHVLALSCFTFAQLPDHARCLAPNVPACRIKHKKEYRRFFLMNHFLRAGPQESKSIKRQEITGKRNGISCKIDISCLCSCCNCTSTRQSHWNN